MAPTRGSAVFFDTNILVYASFPGAPFHDAARARLSELESYGVLFWTSRQVLREFLASTTRPGAVVPPPTHVALSQAVRKFEVEFEIADEDGAVTALLLDLMKARSVQGKQNPRCQHRGYYAPLRNRVSTDPQHSRLHEVSAGYQYPAADSLKFVRRPVYSRNLSEAEFERIDAPGCDVSAAAVVSPGTRFRVAAESGTAAPHRRSLNSLESVACDASTANRSYSFPMPATQVGIQIRTWPITSVMATTSCHHHRQEVIKNTLRP